MAAHDVLVKVQCLVVVVGEGLIIDWTLVHEDPATDLRRRLRAAAWVEEHLKLTAERVRWLALPPAGLGGDQRAARGE